MYNTLYKLKNQVECINGNKHLFAQAAINGRKAAICLANTRNEDVTVRLELGALRYTDVEIVRIDEENRYTLTCESFDGTVKLPATSCAEIRFYDLT